MSVAAALPAMLLAAGLGTRMRPLTETRPKPLVAPAGRTLLDRALDRFEAAGVRVCVVNLHYKGGMIRAHLKDRSRPRIVFSEEPERLETGGGVLKALPWLGEGAFFVANSDGVWLDGPVSALERLARAWDGESLDALLLLHPVARAVGFTGPGDFFLPEREAVRSPVVRPRRRGASARAPFVFTGVQVLHARLFAGLEPGAFSLNRLYDRALAAGRLGALVHDGDWLHVDTPQALEAAADFLDHGGRASGRETG